MTTHLKDRMLGLELPLTLRPDWAASSSVIFLTGIVDRID